MGGICRSATRRNKGWAPCTFVGWGGQADRGSLAAVFRVGPRPARRGRPQESHMRAARERVGRRRFLKGAAVGAAGLVAQPPSPASAAQAPGVVDPGRIGASGGGVPHRSARRGLHGRRPQVARLRVRRGEPRLVVPRPARVDHQLRRQHEARAPDVLPRGVVGGDGARLRQDRRQADAGAWRTAPSACSTRRWRSTTPMPIACPSTSCSATSLDATWRRSDVEWTHSVQDAAAMVRDYTKWDDTPVSLDALRRVGGARLQDRDDAADTARW